MIHTYTPDALGNLRRKHKLTAKATGELLGVSQRTIFKWTSSELVDSHVDMPSHTWRLLLLLLEEVTVSELLEESKAQKSTLSN
jgi:transcriptional regulator with XRE-family HTH domain